MTDTETRTIDCPPWCDPRACQIREPFPGDQKHSNWMVDVPMTLEMPWRNGDDGQWHHNNVMVAMMQGKQ